MYSPQKLKHEYDNMAHGKARMAGIRHAIEEADKNNDHTYQLYFRMELCSESNFFDDAMDMFIVFPEALALVDRHPEIPSTPYNTVFVNGIDHILWVYKWLVSGCETYYQIPLEDCKRFAEDFKRRSLAFGYNLRPYYQHLYYFYERIDKDYSNQCFHEFEKIPRDGNADCEACERNVEIKYYLKQGDLKKADELSKDIENFTLTCREHMNAWLRMKKYYMNYYLERGEFEKAEDYCRLIERRQSAYKEFDKWEHFLYCYSHTDIGKALKIYKDHWKKWLNERCPADAFVADKYICVFFMKLAEARQKQTVKLNLDHTFPLYREDNQYSIAEMFDFYYQRALDTARKFDKRNGTDSYQNELKELLEKEKSCQ